MCWKHQGLNMEFELKIDRKLRWQPA